MLRKEASWKTDSKIHMEIQRTGYLEQHWKKTELETFTADIKLLKLQYLKNKRDNDLKINSQTGTDSRV